MERDARVACLPRCGALRALSRSEERGPLFDDCDDGVEPDFRSELLCTREREEALALCGDCCPRRS